MPVVKPFRTDGDNYLRKTNTDGDVSRQSVIQGYEKQDGSDGAVTNTVFTIATFQYAPGSNTLIVFVNGQKVELVASATDSTEYEETDTITVTFGASLLDTDVVEFIVIGNYTLADGDIYYSKSSDPVRKNLIINGDMRISQRGTSFTGLSGSSNGTYMTDRWKFSESGTVTGVLTAIHSIPTGAFALGFGRALKLDVTTADAAIAADQQVSIAQAIEGHNLQYLKFGGSTAEDITLSFWFWTNKAGTYCVRCRLPDDGYSYISEFTPTATSTWEKHTITIPGSQVAVIDYDTGTGLSISFVLAAGSNYHTTADTWEISTNVSTSNQVNFLDSTDNLCYLTGVQLEVGSEATPFEYIVTSELMAQCQRYFYVFTQQGTYQPLGSIRCSSSGNQMNFNTLPFPVEMRAAPTASEESTSQFTYIHTDDQVTSTGTAGGLVAYTTTDSWTPYDPTRSGTNDDAYIGYPTTALRMEFDSEL